MTSSTVHGASTRSHYAYIAVFSAVLYSVLLVAPVIAGKLATQSGLDAVQIGLIFSVELGCFSLATLPAYAWLRRANIRWVTLGAIIVVVLGNVVSALISDYGLLVVTRGVTSLAAGSITVIILSISARMANPARSYGVFVVCQLAMGALILAVFPLIFADQPVAAIYLTLAVLCALCIPFSWTVRGDELRHDRADAAVAQGGAAVGRRVGAFVAGLIAVFAFYVALGGVWSFMGQIAEAGGTELGLASSMLSIATLFGIGASLLGTILGDSPRHRWYILGGYALMGASILLLLGGPAVVVFTISAICFKIAWSWLLPYLLAAVSRVGGPHVMNSTNLMIGTGLSVAPLLAGAIIQGSGGDFTAMLLVSFAVLLVSIAASVVVIRSASATQRQDLDDDGDVSLAAGRLSATSDS